MKKHLVLSALVSAGLLAGPAFANPTSLSSTKLWFNGDSTVRAFRCEAKKVDTKLDGIEAIQSVDALKEAKVGGKVAINVASLDCNNGTMNDHMRDALNAKTHKDIRLQVKSVDVGAKKGDAVEVQANAELTLHGQTRPVVLRGTASQSGNVLKVKGEHKLNMKDYGVKPPSLMLGTMKVKEDVTVGFELELKVSGDGVIVGAL